MKATDQGQEMYQWVSDLFPLCRSLTGEGVRATLRYLREHLPEMEFFEVPSGTTCFDWTVPDEWNIREAWVANEAGEKIINFAEHNLHVVGYSEPVDKVVSLAELNEHLHSLPDQPNAVPYVTSYYRRNWGFCCTHNLRQSLSEQQYRVYIDSTLAPGHMTYASAFFPGESEKTILLSTYMCHPSMANNELSGPALQTALGRWVKEKKRRHSYLLLYMPETIGAIYYLSRQLRRLQRTVRAGFVLSCCGDDKAWTYLPSREGNTLSDKVLLYWLEDHQPHFKRYSFLDRASDERQYQSPGVDIPVIPFARSLYRHYPEYHTSLDDLRVVSPKGLQESYDALTGCLELLDENRIYRNTCLCEPQLGKRGLYPTTSIKGGYDDTVDIIINFLTHCDGRLDVLDIAKRIGVPALRCLPEVRKLVENGLLEAVD